MGGDGAEGGGTRPEGEFGVGVLAQPEGTILALTPEGGARPEEEFEEGEMNLKRCKFCERGEGKIGQWRGGGN